MSKIKNTLVTIITPTYNRASYLDETITSVLSQNYSKIEYIVIDDGSTDNSQHILNKYRDKIILVHHPNMGETLTVNKGIEMAKGEIICIVNSDDPLLPGAIDKAVETLEKRPDVLAVYTDWNEIGPNSEFIKRVKLPDYNIVNMLTDFNVAMGPGTFIRKTTFDLIGMRDTKFKYVGDLEFWFRIALHGEFAHITEALATHRTHPDSASITDKSAVMADEIIQMVNKVFKNKNVPKYLISIRPKILSIAHRDAIFYCGGNRKESLKHYIKAFLFDPIAYLRSKLYIFKCKLLQSTIPTYYKTRLRIKNKSLYIEGILKTWILRHGLKILKLFYPVIIKTMKLLYPVIIMIMKVGLRSNDGKRKKNVRLKFAFLSHVLPPSWSGQAVVIKRILNDVDPVLYCLISMNNYENHKENYDYIGKLPVKYYALKKENYYDNIKFIKHLKLLYPLLTILFRGWHIAKIIDKENCNVIVAATGDLFDLPAACIAGKITSTHYVPYLFDDYVHQWIDPKTHRLAALFQNLIFKEASEVIVPNEFLGHEIWKRHRLMPTIVHNPCDRLRVKEKKFNKKSRKSINIVYTGAIYHVNFDAFRILIQAISLLDDLSIKLNLYTAQPKKFLEAENIFGKHVELHQHLPPDVIVGAQNAADILFIPFSFDLSVRMIVKTSAPGKFADYLLSGTPILALVPKDAYVSWYLKKYNCGIIVNENNPDAVAEEIIRLINDVNLQKRISKNALQRARLDYNPTKSQRIFTEMLERFL